MNLELNETEKAMIEAALRSYVEDLADHVRNFEGHAGLHPRLCDALLTAKALLDRVEEL